MLETTRIYIADISVLNDSSLYERLLECVPVYRQKKVQSFKFLKGKKQSLGVGLLLKMACMDAGLDGCDDQIAYGDNGKPYFVKRPEVWFNLSHSGERAMCVLSPFEVGCDVEFIKGDRGRLADRFFKSEESAWIKHFESLEKQTEAFYRLWTLKECYMKVTGRGLSLMPDAFALRADENGRFLLFHDGERRDFSFYEFDLNDGYRYACCLKNDGICTPQELKRVDLRTLF